MSENGKGSNTAKRTNFKLFNEGYDKIDWGKKDDSTQKPLPPEVQEKIDAIKQSIEEQDALLQQTRRENEAGE